MIWLNIAGYDGEYQISDKGTVQHITTFKKGRALNEVKRCVASNGKYYITLWKNGNRKTYMLHKVYAEAFGIPVDEAIRILYEGFDGSLSAKDNIRVWLQEKIQDCELQMRKGKNFNDEILYLKAFLKQLND